MFINTPATQLIIRLFIYLFIYLFIFSGQAFTPGQQRTCHTKGNFFAFSLSFILSNDGDFFWS